jgi:hypothetical protein
MNWQQHLPFPTTLQSGLQSSITPITCIFVSFWIIHQVTNGSTSEFHFEAVAPSYLFNMLFNKKFETHHAWILSSSSLKVGTWLPIRLTFPTFQLSSPSFSIVLQMWLGLPYPSIVGIPRCVCTHPINTIGVHLFMLCPWQWMHRNPWWCSLWHFCYHCTRSWLPCGMRTITRISFNHIPLLSTLCSPKMEFAP